MRSKRIPDFVRRAFLGMLFIILGGSLILAILIKSVIRDQQTTRLSGGSFHLESAEVGSRHAPLTS
jgi:hypothetical protein